MALTDFFSSPWFYGIVVIVVFYVILRMISQEVFGKPIGAVILENRAVQFDDVDAMAHLRLWRDLARASKFSKGSRPSRIYLRPSDPNFYSTEWAGMHFLGKVKGYSTYPSAHIVLFRKPWGFRKFILVAPPALCLSGTGARNLIYEGASVNVINMDYVYPIPSQGGTYKEQEIRKWFLAQYKIWMKMHSDAFLVDWGETLLLKAGSDSIEARLAQQQLGAWMQRTEGDEIEDGTGEVMG